MHGLPFVLYFLKERKDMSAENHELWVSLGLEDYEESYDKLVEAHKETKNRDDSYNISILLTENAMLRGERDFWKATATELYKSILHVLPEE